MYSMVKTCGPHLLAPQAPWLALSLCSLRTPSAQQWGRADDCHSYFQMRKLRHK